MVRKKTTRKKTSRKSTRKKSTSRRSKSTTLNASQKRLKERQTSPWTRIDKLNLKDPEIYQFPWGMVPPGAATYLPGIGHVGQSNPLFADYASKHYSWQRFILSKCKGKDTSINTPHPEGTNPDRFVLRDDQTKDIAMVKEAFKHHAPEFLIANKTGTGKTVTTWAAVKELGVKSVLVICPQAVIPVWQQHIREMGDNGMQIVVINYESLKSLVAPSARAVQAKKTATQNKYIALDGVPYVDFDVIVVDETHKVKNPTAQQSRIAATLCNRAKFTIRLSATPGKDPAQLHYLWRGLSFATGNPIKVEDEKDFSSYISWCKDHGIGNISPAAFGNGIAWNGNKDDLDAMSKILYGKGSHGLYWATQRKGDSPDTVRQSLPVSLDAQGRREYELEVKQATRAVLDLQHSDKKDLSKGLAAIMSLRQKSGVLKAQAVVDYTKYCLEDLDEQVVISSVFHNTTETIGALLDKQKIDYVVIDGTMSADEKEEARQLFQTGQVKVVVCSITTGISLHACEREDSSENVRRMIVADLQYSPIEHLQLEGRINRNGQHGVITIPYLEDSVDEKITTTLLRGMQSQAVIQKEHGVADDIALFATALGLKVI